MSKDKNIERTSKLDTASLSDAMDQMGINGVCLDIKPRSHSFHMTGRAFTVLYTPADVRPGTVGDFIDDVEAGAVVVIDNGGRANATVWGDIMTQVAHSGGLAGTVIDGANRDIQLCLDLGYPIYSRSYSMRTGKDRVQLESINTPVNIGDARVSPGDIMRGDADGVVVLPQEYEEEIITVAEKIETVEGKILMAVQGGKSLKEARSIHHYHTLQRKRS